ncbi:MAG: hypothetical protein MUE85_07805 [Microscillaceae bacterium]|jgi:hypothetical protein|nr:hypothetical protein [Microscillaceae bacterium]
MQNIKKLGLILTFILVSISAGYAQYIAENYWHIGKIYLDTGDTLAGNFKFNLTNEVVQIEVNNTLQTFTARKVLSFEFFDRAEQRDRIFYTLPYPKVPNYKTPIFFELLLEGDAITVLSRETLVTQTTIVNNPYFIGQPGVPMRQTFVKTNFYFLYKNGKIKPYDGTKKDLLLLLQDREKDVKDYLKNNRVRLDNRQDVVALIDFYNQKKKTN